MDKHGKILTQRNISRRGFGKGVLATLGVAALGILMCPESVQQPISEPEVPYDKKIYRRLQDEDIESTLEDLLKYEFDINLRVPNDVYGSEEVNKDVQKSVALLREIREINPLLIEAAKGLDLFAYPIIPTYLKIAANYKTTNGVDGSLDLLPGRLGDLGAWIHAISRVQVTQLGKDFLLGWKAHVKKSEFYYDDNIAEYQEDNIRRTGWKEHRISRNEPQGVFPNFEASRLSEERVGHPFEHIASIFYRIYDNRVIFADSKEAYNCYLELFGYAFNQGLFTEAEYIHAQKLLQPVDVVAPQKDWRAELRHRDEIVDRWGIPLKEIAEANGILYYDIPKLEGATQVIIPLEREMDGELVDGKWNYEYHTVSKKDEDGLGKLAEKLRHDYRTSFITQARIIEHNKSRITDPDVIKVGWLLKFPVPEQGLLYQKKTQKLIKPLLPSGYTSIMRYGSVPFQISQARNPGFFSN